MKRKLSLLLITAGLMMPLLSGCPAPAPEDPSDPDAVHPSPDVPVPESIDFDYFDVDPVDKAAHTFTEPEVYELFKEELEDESDGHKTAQMMADVFNEAKISVAQATLMADISANVSLDISNPSTFSPFLSKILTLLNSLDGNQLQAILTVANRVIKENAAKNYHEEDYELVKYYERDLTYNQWSLEQLRLYKTVADGETKGDDEFKAAGNALDEAIDILENYRFTQDMIDEVVQAKADAKKKATEDTIPGYAIQYAKDSGASLIHTLSRYIQAIGSIVIPRLEKAVEGYYVEGNGLKLKVSGYSLQSPISLSSLLTMFTISDAKDIIKAVGGTAEDNKVIFEFLRKLLLPVLFDKAAPTEDAALIAKRQEFMNALNALQTTALDNLAKFFIAVVDLVDQKDVDEYTSGNVEKIVANIKAKIPLIRTLVNAMDETEKYQIGKIFELLGVDVFTLLEDEMKYVENAKVVTEAEKEAFAKHFEELGDELTEKVQTKFVSLFGAKEAEPDDYWVQLENPYGTFEVGEEVTKEKISYISVYSSEHPTWTITSDMITGFSLDTSKAGYVDAEISFNDFDGNPVTFTYAFEVVPVIKYSFTCYATYYFNSVLQTPDEWNVTHNSDETMDYFQMIYYADFNSASEDEITVEETFTDGLYIPGSEDFEKFPSIFISYMIEAGYGFEAYAPSKSGTLYLNDDVKELLSNEDGMHSIQYNGLPYHYETINEPKMYEETFVVPTSFFSNMESGEYEELDMPVRHDYCLKGNFVEGDTYHSEDPMPSYHVSDVKLDKDEGTLSFVYNGLIYMYRD